MLLDLRVSTSCQSGKRRVLFFQNVSLCSLVSLWDSNYGEGICLPTLHISIFPSKCVPAPLSKVCGSCLTRDPNQSFGFSIDVVLTSHTLFSL